MWQYELPFGHGKLIGHGWNGFLDRAFGGREVGGFGILQSGRPTTVYSNTNDYTLSSIVRTVASCTGCSPHMFSIHRDPDTQLLTYLTPDQIAKFSTPAPGEFSNVGRNYFRLAGYSNLSLSLAKKTPHYGTPTIGAPAGNSKRHKLRSLRRAGQQSLRQLRYRSSGSFDSCRGRPRTH